MEIRGIASKIQPFFKKYGYVVLIFFVGLAMMLLPGSSNSQQKEVSSKSESTQYKQSLEERLSAILSRVAGAGDVQVVLSIAAGEETLFQTNDDITNNEENGSMNTNTVTVIDSDRNENGLIRQVIPEIYQGAVVVCTGADDPQIKLEIVDAVSKVTGLGANKISVLKMK